MTTCARCGACCSDIRWGYPGMTREGTWERTIEMAAAGGSPDAEFIVEHWHYCWGTGQWWCDCLDFETKLCRVHEQKERVCAGYPYYGGDKLPAELHTGCAFEADR